MVDEVTGLCDPSPLVLRRRGEAPRASRPPIRTLNGTSAEIKVRIPGYFQGDTGQGLGASCQTGWTALIATRLDDLGEDLWVMGLGRC